MREVDKYLRTGENMLWESMPERFPLLEGNMKVLILGEWIVTLLFAAALLYVERDDPKFSTGAVALVMVVAAAIILAPIVEYYSLKNQRYYLTDQRAILLTKSENFYYMDYDKIDDCQVIDGIAQGSCIIMETVRRELRWQSCHPKTDLQGDGSGEAMGMVFYLPQGLKKMVQLMKDSGVQFA